MKRALDQSSNQRFIDFKFGTNGDPLYRVTGHFAQPPISTVLKSLTHVSTKNLKSPQRVFLFCELSLHVKFQNPSTTFLGKKKPRERERR